MQCRNKPENQCDKLKTGNVKVIVVQQRDESQTKTDMAVTCVYFRPLSATETRTIKLMDSRKLLAYETKRYGIYCMCVGRTVNNKKKQKKMLHKSALCKAELAQ